MDESLPIAAPATIPPIRVLLVEDSPTDALLLMESLREVSSIHFELKHLTSRTAAIAMLQHQSFDVVLLDLGLPESRGLETFVYFHEHVPRIPTIVLSGLNDEDVALATVNKGAQDYLVKGSADGRMLARAIRYAIERKRVEETLRLHNEQLREDLKLAREFQSALLPRKYPSFPANAAPEHSTLRFHHFYEPSSLVGGDFFDVLRLSDTQAGVFICDVMGHGVRAALVTALIRGLLEKLKNAASDPGHFLAEINQSLATVLKHTGITLFATAFYMVVDVAQATVRYATAGHPSPLHLHRKDGTMERIYQGNDPTGCVLGLPWTAAFLTTEKPFRQDDVILLYTDGLREIANQEGDEFGFERMQSAVRARLSSPTGELLQGLVNDALRFAGTKTFDDDVCMVAVEWA